MNLLPIVYTSLLIFSIFVVLLISISFALYKLKGSKTESINSESTFVLRRPATFSTAPTKIIYQSSSEKKSNQDINQNNFAKRQNNARTNNRNFINERKIETPAQQNLPNNYNSERYRIISNYNNSANSGGGYITARSQKSLNWLNYYDDTFDPKSYHSGNHSQLF